MTDLHDALAEPPDETAESILRADDETRQAWAIASYPPEARDKIASWCFRRLALVAAEQKRLLDAYVAEKQRLDRWMEDALRPLKGDEEFFKGALAAYLRRIREERGEDPRNPTTKTYKLPTGVITGRAGSERIEVIDEDAFIAWAEAGGHEELVRVKKEVAKDAIKKMTVAKDGVSVILSSGERAPFVEVRRGEEKLDAKPTVEVDRG